MKIDDIVEYHNEVYTITDLYYEEGHDIATLELNDDFSVSAEAVNLVYTILSEKLAKTAKYPLQVLLVSTDKRLPFVLRNYNDYIVHTNDGFLIKYVKSTQRSNCFIVHQLKSN